MEATLVHPWAERGRLRHTAQGSVGTFVLSGGALNSKACSPKLRARSQNIMALKNKHSSATSSAANPPTGLNFGKRRFATKESAETTRLA